MIRTVLAAAALAVAASAAGAATVFSEDFDDEALAYGTQLNFTTDPGEVFSSGFGVRNGTVDLIAAGNPFGIACAGGSMGCLDLNGSTGDNGLLFTNLGLVAGQTYELSFSLSGNQGRNTLNDTVGYGLLRVPTASYLETVRFDEGFATYTQTFRVAADGTYTLFFKNGGPDSDNIGAILDNVALAAVPLPAAGFLLLGAIGGLAALRRRRAAA